MTVPGLLITAVGKQTYLVDAFRDAMAKPENLVIADAAPEARALAMPVTSVILPKSTDPRYLPAVIQTCRHHSLGWVLSLNASELVALDGAREGLLSKGIEVLGPQGDQLRVCVDKRRTHRWLQQHGIAHPPTIVGANAVTRKLAAAELPLPVIGKLATSQGGRGQEVLSTPNRVMNWLSGLSHAERDEAIVQPVLEGTEYGVDLVNRLDGSTATVLVREKLAMRGGETATARTVRNSDIESLGWQLASKLGHRGLVDTDIFLTKDGPVVLDINPRFGGGYPFVHFAGANVPSAIAAWIRGEEPNPKDLSYRSGVIGTRHETGGAIERMPVGTVEVKS